MITKHFDPKKGFFSLPIVISTATIIFIIAVVLSIYIISTSNLVYKEGYEGINNLFTIFKAPLAFIALLVPIGAIYAVQHRSEQTKIQINLAMNQNDFANYYKHIEEFEKYIKAYNLGVFGDTRKIHYLLFPKARKGDFELDATVINSLFKESLKNIGEGIESESNYRVLDELAPQIIGDNTAEIFSYSSVEYRNIKILRASLPDLNTSIINFFAAQRIGCFLLILQRFSSDKIKVSLSSDIHFLQDFSHKILDGLLFKDDHFGGCRIMNLEDHNVVERLKKYYLELVSRRTDN